MTIFQAFDGKNVNFTSLLFFLVRGWQRRKQAKAAELAALAAMPSPFARESGETPSQTFRNG